MKNGLRNCYTGVGAGDRAHSHRRIGFVCLTCVMLLLIAAPGSAEYSWQKAQAQVTAKGDLIWAPEPFKFVAGEQMRYIDFENGNDDNNGLSPESAWKHHPWDVEAQGVAAEAGGAITYVFKRGVDYRGALEPDESGEDGNPIRLTSSSEWGDGEARIMAATRLPSQWVFAEDVDYPQRLSSPENTWALDMNAAGLLDDDGEIQTRNPNSFWGRGTIDMPFVGLFRLDESDSSHTQHLARTPDWEPGNDNFVLDYWHKLDGGKDLMKDGKLAQRGAYDEDWVGLPQDWFDDGYIWMQYGHFMGTPIPRYMSPKIKTKQGDSVYHFNPDKGVIYEGCYGQWMADLRYMVENLPQYLDSPEEFYFDKESGYLFYLPPEGISPNDARLELSTMTLGVFINDCKNIEISGLTFRYQTTAGVQLDGDAENITIRNCSFEDILQYGVKQSFANWRVHPEPEYAGNLRVTDSRFINIWEGSIDFSADRSKDKILGHVDILRNFIYNNGMRHKGNVQSAVPALRASYMITGEIAGNVLERCFGSGIMSHGGTQGKGQADCPLSRILVHHNKTVNTALGVNDYGGMSLWQGGAIYCYNNNIGNSPGFMPAGITMFGGKKGGMNLSYPLYLDGAYKVYSFNNIIWAQSNDKEKDRYATGTPGYFMVFGFLNQFVNNTLYRHGSGVGGSSGHRNDVVGNVFSEIKMRFISHDRSGDPSLVGGGDDGSSGRRGIPTLAYARNVFYGEEAAAGRLLRPNVPLGIDNGIEAEEVPVLSDMMRDFPIRFGGLGEETEVNPIVGKSDAAPIENIGEVDFSPVEGSAAINAGGTYFVPWSLYGTVGEWHFTENEADPSNVMDYSWYMSKAHYHRMMYEFVPPNDLRTNDAAPETYVESPSEDWVNGAVSFDGSRYASISDASLREDIVLPMVWTDRKGDKQVRKDLPEEEWILPEPVSGSGSKATYADDAVLRYPGDLRKTPIISTQNVLIEAIIRVEGITGAGAILGKHDGISGYRLFVDDAGRAVFRISSDGVHNEVFSAVAVNDDSWRHILAEVDRNNKRMAIYVDGELSAESQATLAVGASLDCSADFLVGKSANDAEFLKGAVDFVRVCRGTLADSETTIEELYEWQNNGPSRFDMAGTAPKGRRDAGALEFLGDVGVVRENVNKNRESDLFGRAARIGVEQGKND